MTKIPLRSYSREIESLIERGMTEEAIGHCRFILKYYPKHIETYKLLGKSFLESQRYSEAADILQRVLSVYPDDFFAQIGMSIIREDEGNLDAAIFHMERAYETQPANIAVQDELRRLYGRRDGVEPPKLRLSRGALVRMYARGGLHRQAISEIRAALAEDPQRLDLEALLAKIYHITGEKVEAVEVASRLIAKLPFSFDANLILAEILPSTAHAQDARIYLERLIALDPYMAYLTPSAPTSQQVADNAVLVDRLEWQATEATREQPAWARNVGVQIAQETETQPDWLTEIPKETPKPTPGKQSPEELAQPIIPVPIESQAEKADIPDWMQQAGWAVTTQPQEESPEPIIYDEEISLDLEPAKAELPDWLKNIAPSGLEADQLDAQEIEKLNLLDQILPPADADAPERLRDEGQVTPVEAVETSNPEAPITAGDLPDWLRDLSASQTEETSQASQPSIPELPQPEPDFFQQISDPVVEAGQGEALTESDINQPIPDWLQGIGLPEFDNATDPVPVGQEEIKTTIPEVFDAESASNFDSLSESIPAEQEAPPEFIIEDQAFISPLNLEMGVTDEQIPPNKNGEIEEKLDLPTILASETPSQIEEIPALENEPDSMVVDAPTADVLQAPPIESSLEPVTELLVDLPNAEITETPTSEQATITQEIQQPLSEDATIPNLTDADAAMAWLESLAARQGAAEETLITRPEDRHETPPDWVLEANEQGGMAPTSLEDVSTFVAEVEVADESVTSDHIEEIHPDNEVQVLPEMTLHEEATVVEIPIAPTSDATQQPPADMDFDTAFAWLESLAAQQGADAGTLITSPEERQETPPAWVLEPLPEETDSPTQPVRVTPVEPVAIEPQPVVLEENPSISLEGESPVEANTSFEVATPPESDISLPVFEHEGPADSELIPQTSGLKPLPDWLKGIEVEPEPVTAEVDGNVELPSWLEEKELPHPEIELPAPVKEGEPLPEWMVTSPLNDVAETSDSISPKEDESSEEPVPGWLQELEATNMGKSESSASDAEPPTLETIAKYDEQEAIPAGTETPGMLLNQAQTALSSGKIEISMRYYSRLIQNGVFVEEAIHDLRDGLYRFPVDISIWQTLGDAFLRNNQIQEALDAYTKAEEFLR